MVGFLPNTHDNFATASINKHGFRHLEALPAFCYILLMENTKEHPAKSTALMNLAELELVWLTKPMIPLMSKATCTPFAGCFNST